MLVQPGVLWRGHSPPCKNYEFWGGVPLFCIYVKLVKFLAMHFPKEERGKVHPIYKEEC